LRLERLKLGREVLVEGFAHARLLTPSGPRDASLMPVAGSLAPAWRRWWRRVTRGE
jgi:hypothetical protein